MTIPGIASTLNKSISINAGAAGFLAMLGNSTGTTVSEEDNKPTLGDLAEYFASAFNDVAIPGGKYWIEAKDFAKRILEKVDDYRRIRNSKLKLGEELPKGDNQPVGSEDLDSADITHIIAEFGGGFAALVIYNNYILNCKTAERKKYLEFFNASATIKIADYAALLVGAMDTDGDGRIYWDEFSDYMRAYAR